MQIKTPTRRPFAAVKQIAAQRRGRRQESVEANPTRGSVTALYRGINEDVSPRR